MQISAHGGILVFLALVLSSGLFQSACGKKNKVAIAPVTGVRIALIPLNVPSGKADLRWAALATPVMMAKVSEYAKDIEVVPLWQSMPISLEAAGKSRSITQDSAAYVASWLGVKWSAMGEISPTKSGVSIMIDFIPDRDTQVPFRFMKSGTMDDIASKIPLAYNQFFYYLGARRLTPPGKKLPELSSMKGLAEALDREYGWFVEAEPGKAEKVVADLAATDARLAQLLFNPTLYPALARKK